jgi:hypothetical protein
MKPNSACPHQKETNINNLLFILINYSRNASFALNWWISVRAGIKLITDSKYNIIVGQDVPFELSWCYFTQYTYVIILFIIYKWKWIHILIVYIRSKSRYFYIQCIYSLLVCNVLFQSDQKWIHFDI